MERNAAPESLLKIISCNCKKGCNNACGCRKAGLICSSLCSCSLGEACKNVSDMNLLEDSIEDENDTPSSINNFIYENIEDLYLQLRNEKGVVTQIPSTKYSTVGQLQKLQKELFTKQVFRQSHFL
ncbi:hypothetical protein AVEN_2268-1 [Araneus ventricosus]|uniref:Tesmin/TSO1-like CXC domain-containing protein n=1 Tax=Araneus ventricosus TaxID=182803 RepID=A0A4Y2FNT8_ARAVE|nr:hypothetical protein AVEN_2268-1 [Araneus ventricosus]